MKLSVGTLLTGIVGCLIHGGCGKGSASELPVPFWVESEPSVLASRMDTTNVAIDLVNPPEAVLTGLIPGVESFTAVQVAELTPPTVNGLRLQADEVINDGNSTYVSYNVAGEAYAGGIDILDISNILSLKILSSFQSSTSEFNALTRSGNYLYAAGAGSSGRTSGAFLTRIALNGSLMTSDTSQYLLPSYSGTSLIVNTNQILALSGDAGGLSLFDKATMNLITTVPIDDARAVKTAADGSVVVLSGQPGTVRVLSASGSVQKTVILGGAATPQSKSTLQIGSKWSIASLGEGGAVIYCNLNGTIIERIPATIVAGIPASLTVTNAASSVGGLVFTANGEAGVYVYSLKDVTTLDSCGDATLTLLGKLNLGANFSANSVYYQNGLLFIVTGLGGLKILSPTYVSTTPLSSNL